MCQKRRLRKQIKKIKRNKETDENETYENKF